MRVLSRLPERSMFGFSRLVARDVTQPLWPSSWPRITNCSVMLGKECLEKLVEDVLMDGCSLDVNFPNPPD